MGDKITIARKRDDNFVEWTVEWDGETLSVGTRDRVTGGNKRVVVVGDTPEWGNWKREDPHHDQ